MSKISYALLFCLTTAFLSAGNNEQFQIEMKKVSCLEIITIDSIKHTGRILYVRDSFLLFWETTLSFESNYLDKYGIIYNYSDIERINIKSAKNAVASLTGGALVGVSSGIVYGERVYQREAGSCFRLPIEYYIIKYACIFGGTGSVVGGIIGSIFDKEGFSIKGDFDLYRKILPTINQHAVFPYYLPVELHNFIQESKKRE